MTRPVSIKEYYPPRVMTALRGICDHPLTAVCGLTGTGKTAFMREFSARQRKKGTRLLWYSAFGEPLDISWSQICGQIAVVDADAAASMRELGFPERHNLSQVAGFVQNIQCTEETVLIIDNAQMFNSDIPYEMLYALSQHRAPKFHIVIVTQNQLNRPDVPFNAPGVMFIGMETMILQAPEVRHFFKQNGVDLSKHELKQVMDNTFGWIVPMRLQLQGYWRSGTIQREAKIDQLLQAIVWDQLDRQEQFILKATSLFERISAANLCTLLNLESVPEYVHASLNRGGLAYYDFEQLCYVLHPMFRVLAQNHFQKLAAREQRTLLKRAAQIYAEEGDIYQAVNCLLRADDFEAIMELPLSNADLAEYGNKDVLSILRKIVDSCPHQVLLRYPAKLIRFAFEFLMRGNETLYKKTCEIIDEALEHQDKKNESAYQKNIGEYSFLRAFENIGDAEVMHELFHKAMDELGGPSKTFSGGQFWSFGVPSILTPFWTGEESLDDQIDGFVDILPTYTQLTNGHGSGAAELMQAEAHLHAGNLDEASIYCHRTIFLAKEHNQDTMCFGALLTLGRIAVLRGDSEGYVAIVDRVREQARQGTEKNRHYVADQCHSLLEMSLGRVDGMPYWLEDADEIQNKMYEAGVCYTMRLYTKHLLIKQDFLKLVGYVEPLREKARQQRFKMLEIYYLIYLACAEHMMGFPAEAEAHILEAMDIALPNQIYLPFAEHADTLAPLYEKLRGSRVPPRIIGRIIALGNKQRSGAAKIKQAMYGSSGKLTEREKQIVQFVKKGYTNKEISEFLGTSTETIKMALKFVYKKLMIHRRQQLNDIIV